MTIQGWSFLQLPPFHPYNLHLWKEVVYEYRLVEEISCISNLSEKLQ